MSTSDPVVLPWCVVRVTADDGTTTQRTYRWGKLMDVRVTYPPCKPQRHAGLTTRNGAGRTGGRVGAKQGSEKHRGPRVGGFGPWERADRPHGVLR